MFWRGKNNSSLLRVGIGAGLVGGAMVALRYATKPPVKSPLPDEISPKDFATRVFESSQGDLIYHSRGQGLPLIFLHSICVGASSYEWSRIYPEFSNTHHVMALDLLGFGESSRPGGVRTAEDHVSYLAEFIRGACRGSQPVVIASGLSAGIAVLLASQHPDLVMKLCLLMPTGLSEFGKRRVTWRANLIGRTPWVNDFAYRNYLSREATIRDWFTEFAFSNPDLVTDEMVNIYTTCAQQYGAEHAIQHLLTGRFNIELEDRMTELTQPVRLLWGEDATFPPLKWAERYRDAIPKCTLTTLPNASVLAALEAPDAVSAILHEEFAHDLRVVL